MRRTPDPRIDSAKKTRAADVGDPGGHALIEFAPACGLDRSNGSARPDRAIRRRRARRRRASADGHRVRASRAPRPIPRRPKYKATARWPLLSAQCGTPGGTTTPRRTSPGEPGLSCTQSRARTSPATAARSARARRTRSPGRMHEAVIGEIDQVFAHGPLPRCSRILKDSAAGTVHDYLQSAALRGESACTEPMKNRRRWPTRRSRPRSRQRWLRLPRARSRR